MTAIDEGLLSPVTVGRLESLVDDATVLDALVLVEVSLARAYARIGVAPAEAAQAIEREFLPDRGTGYARTLDVREIAEAAVAGGNPVIPLVGALKKRVPAEARTWVHRGATSQDILDTALMFVAQRAVDQVRRSLRDAVEWMLQLAAAHRDDVVAARTLTQHAVPTTIGLRAAGWARSAARAGERLAALEFPVQLAGAGGTLASFVEVTGSAQGARDLVAAFAADTQLAVPASPWHVARWPVTELGDALVQAIDAVGKFAADVATLSRTEIAELAEGTGGGSSAMPQKQNPTEAVLIRSAALRAPQLGATLHLASALAVDERPDGAWHAEWPTLRELLRLALGATWHASSLAAHLRVDTAAGTRDLAASDGLLVAERLSLVLGPLLGKPAVDGIVAAVGEGRDLAEAVRSAVASAGGADVDVDALIDPAGYTGLAGDLVDDALRVLRSLRGGEKGEK